MAKGNRRHEGEVKLPGRDWPDCTAEDLRVLLRKKHQECENSIEWIYIEELRTATGAYNLTSIDAWAMNTMPFRNFKRISYEIKISRGDFLREIKNPEKRSLALRYSNHFYFVTPPGIAHASEIPEECGLIEYGKNGVPFTRVKAPWRDTAQPSWQFMASVQREIKRRARSRAMEETAYFTAQQAASIQGQIDLSNDAQSRAAGAWEVIQAQEIDIDDRRKAINEVCLAAGLPIPHWYTVDREIKEAREERLAKWGYSTSGNRGRRSGSIR